MKAKHIITGLVGALTAVAATMLYMRKQRADERPPRRAPQVKIENPGEQSDFPPTPSGERDLG